MGLLTSILSQGSSILAKLYALLFSKTFKRMLAKHKGHILVARLSDGLEITGTLLDVGTDYVVMGTKDGREIMPAHHILAIRVASRE